VNLTLKEAAQWLRVHEQTLLERARAGKIPGAAKPGKCWVFPQSGLQAYLNSLAPCPYTEGVVSGGSNSTRIKVDIGNLLGLPTRKPRRNSTKSASQNSGAETNFER
jgi:excisionase family DNA binding protein